MSASRFERVAALGGDPRETLTYFAEAERRVREASAAADQKKSLPKPVEVQRYFGLAEHWQGQQAAHRAAAEARWASWRAFEG
jgi:hypothetical protein